MNIKHLNSSVPASFLLVVLLVVFGSARPAFADVSQATSQLLTGIMANNASMVRAALDDGADVNADTGEGRTPPIIAAMSTRPDAVKLLLEHGADPKRRSTDAAIGNAVTAAFFAMDGTEITGRTGRPRNPAGSALHRVRRPIWAQGSAGNRPAIVSAIQAAGGRKGR